MSEEKPKLKIRVKLQNPTDSPTRNHTDTHRVAPERGVSAPPPAELHIPRTIAALSVVVLLAGALFMVLRGNGDAVDESPLAGLSRDVSDGGAEPKPALQTDQQISGTPSKKSDSTIRFDTGGSATPRSSTPPAPAPHIRPDELDSISQGLAASQSPEMAATAVIDENPPIVHTLPTEPTSEVADDSAEFSFSSSHVVRAQLTNGIAQGEPIDNQGPIVYSDEQGVKQLYYFTEIKDMKGKTVNHRWNYEGQSIATVQFEIRGDRWRVYSSKRIPNHMTGEWEVVVVDSDGMPLTATQFIYASQ